MPNNRVIVQCSNSKQCTSLRYTMGVRTGIFTTSNETEYEHGIDP